MRTPRPLRRGGDSFPLSRTVTNPELPPSAMDVPTRLEQTRVTSKEIGLPVDVRASKATLQPVYEQMQRQMPVTQRDANPGLLAIKNILDGPDHAPLSQVDRDLSVIKKLARSQGGLAKMAVAKREADVARAVGNGGPEASRALEMGRKATAAKYATQDLINALPGGKMEEPVAVFKRATAPHDGGIELLRNVQQHAPQVIPQIARAKLDELLSLATEKRGFEHSDKLYAEWQKLGGETKRILYPQAGQAQALDHFFLLAKKLATNPNPSGTGAQVMHLVEGGVLWAHRANPLTVIAGELGAAGLSKLLHSQLGVHALTQRLSLSLAKASPAAQAAATARVLSIAPETDAIRLARPWSMLSAT